MGWYKQRQVLSVRLVLLFVFLMTTAAVKEEAVASSFGRYHAVVIGNQNYQYLEKLNTPLNDARDIARILEQQYDFNVTLLLDKKRDETMRSLSELRRTMAKEDNLLIYYAGHGILDEDTDVGYWQPIDADDSVVNWIPFTDLITLLKGLQANHILVIADSCFAGALQMTRNSGAALDYGSESWLRRMREKKSRTALTSGGIEDVLDGGGGNHSIFAKAIIDTLRENNTILDGQSLFDQVKLLVVNKAAQTPNYDPIRLTGHEFGDFIFIPKGLTETSVDKSPKGSIRDLTRSPKIDEDRRDWEMLSKLGEDGLKSYLLLHQDGKWAGEARKRIARLQPKSEPQRPVSAARTLTQAEKDRLESEWQREQHANSSSTALNRTVSKEEQDQIDDEWQKIQGASTSHTIEGFLRMYPVGSHVPAVQQRLAELRALGR
ncbi:MAG: Caspase domain-containing protein [Candidatus Electronema aureum]|uniref:Caspase domain-containing protein n=1 Tax=Candidatus Electronema aureum TaxID=2005002 RepID=A0A521G2R7_9BACT|nr:MAG: Caspase domain-containing protein [Candidatus Electronema aureum]